MTELNQITLKLNNTIRANRAEQTALELRLETLRAEQKIIEQLLTTLQAHQPASRRDSFPYTTVFRRDDD